MRNFGIYIEYDVLFDTRLSLIFSIDENIITPEFIKNYLVREEDKIEDLIDKNTFKELYELRNKNILENAKLTKMLEILKATIYEKKLSCVNNPLFEDVDVYLNLYPYKFNKEEIDAITLSLETKLSNTVKVIPIYKNLNDLSPEYYMNKIDLFYMYNDYGKWIDIHYNSKKTKNFKKLNIELYVPKLLFGKELTQEDRNKIRVMEKNPFDYIKDIMNVVLTFDYLEIEYFSIDPNLFTD